MAFETAMISMSTTAAGHLAGVEIADLHSSSSTTENLNHSTITLIMYLLPLSISHCYNDCTLSRRGRVGGLHPVNFRRNDSSKSFSQH